MVQSLLFLALTVTARASDFTPGTAVTLNQDVTDPVGSPARKCGPITAGSKGIVFDSYFNTDETVGVKWSNWKKGCQLWERINYVNVANLALTGSAPPAAPKPTDCPATQSTTMEQLLHKVNLADASETKDGDELERYIGCYFVNDHQEYLQKFKPMIESAAAEFKVDPSLMKCLLLRESQYDPNCMSCTCATGLGQQVMQNVDEVGKLVGDSRGRILSNTKAANDVAQSWDEYMKKIKVKNPSWLDGCSGGFLKSSPVTESDSFYKQALTHREKGCGKNPTACTIFRQDDRRCPAASIAATGAYLNLIEKTLSKAVACHQIEWWQVNDSRIAMALAYNAGEGTATHALKGADQMALMSTNILNGSNVSSGKKKEMMGHYRALRNCLQKGNTGSPAVGTPEKPACFGQVVRSTSTTVTH